MELLKRTKTTKETKANVMVLMVLFLIIPFASASPDLQLMDTTAVQVKPAVAAETPSMLEAQSQRELANNNNNNNNGLNSNALWYLMNQNRNNDNKNNNKNDNKNNGPNNNNNDNKNNNKNNDKNNDKNKNDNDGGFQWSRPWETQPDPTPNPTPKPTKAPTTDKPTNPPTTPKPTPSPTQPPTTRNPTLSPTSRPTPLPTTRSPTLPPTPAPTNSPTLFPTNPPTTRGPTLPPTTLPPTPYPAPAPTDPPATAAPTAAFPTTARPTTLASIASETLEEAMIYPIETTAPTNLTVITAQTTSSIPTALPTVARTLLMPTASPTFLPPSMHPDTVRVEEAVPTQSTTTDPTTTPPEPKALDTDELSKIQVPSSSNGSDLQYSVSLAFALWFPDSVGVNGAEEEQGTNVQSGIINVLGFLFCDPDKRIFLNSLGLSDFNNNNLCPFSENVVQGKGTVALSLDGGRNLKGDKWNGRNDDMGIKDNKATGAYEHGRWDQSEWADLDAKFEQLQKEKNQANGGVGDKVQWNEIEQVAEDRKDEEGVAIYAVQVGDNTATLTYNGQVNDKGGEKNGEKGKDNDKGNDKGNGKNKEDGNKENEKKEDENKQEQQEEIQIVVDLSVLTDPPHLQPHVHFNAHKNLAWTTWNVTWPVARLSMDYLKRSWELRSGFENVEMDDIFEYGVHLLQQDMTKYLNDNIAIKVMDVMLEDLLQEPVRASVFGHAFSTYVDGESPIPEGADDDEHMGYNMTADEAAGHANHLQPHPAHALRLIGITMLLFTKGFIVILILLSRRRKNAREAEYKRLKENNGLLHSPEGVDEMLNKTGAAPRSLYRPGKSTLSEGLNRLRQQDTDDTGSEQDYELNIPMPINLKG